MLSENDVDFAGEGDANGQKVVVQGHVRRQVDGKFKVAFSELGRPPAYSGKTELTLAPGERRVAVIWSPGLAKDQNGHSRFEVH